MSRNRILSLTALFFIFLGCCLSFTNLPLILIKWAEILLSRQLEPHFWEIGMAQAGITLLMAAISMIAYLTFYHKWPELTMKTIASGWLILFVTTVLKTITNIPYHDDYFFLEFLVAYSENYQVSEFFAQGNESRWPMIKTMTVLLYHLGSFNFKTLILIALACLIGSAILIIRYVKISGSAKGLLAVLIFVLVFQFEYYDSVVWASGALYNSCALFFAIASLYFLTTDRKHSFSIGLVFALLCLSISGAGFACFACGAAYLLIQKEWKKIGVWSSVVVVISIFYFSNYSLVDDNYDGNGSVQESLLQKLINCLAFSPTFLGSSFQFMYQPWLPFLAGLFIWYTLLNALRNGYHRKNPAISFILLFILILSITPPVIRNNFNMIEGINIRYGIYSIFAVCCCIIIWLEQMRDTKQERAIRILLPFAVCFNILTGIFFFPEAVLRKEKALIMASEFKYTGSALLPDPYKQGPDNAPYLFAVCREKGIYKLPE